MHACTHTSSRYGCALAHHTDRTHTYRRTRNPAWPMPQRLLHIYIYVYIYARQSFPNLVYSILENTRNFFAIQFWSFEFVSYPNSYYIYISSFANLVWIFEKIYLIGCGKFFITSLNLIVRIWLSCWPNFPNLGKAKIRHFSLTQPKRTLALQFVSGEYDLTGGNSNRKSM